MATIAGERVQGKLFQKIILQNFDPETVLKLKSIFSILTKLFRNNMADKIIYILTELNYGVLVLEWAAWHQLSFGSLKTSVYKITTFSTQVPCN